MNLFPIGYSFLILAVVFIIVTGIILLTNKPKWNDYVAFSVIVISLLVAWSIIRPRQTVLQTGAQEVQNLIGSGTPVLLEFQSPYCVACISINPIVAELEKEINGNRNTDKKIHIIQLNIQDQIGMDLLSIYGFQFTPTFIYFDKNGTEQWRLVGSFDPQKVRDSLNQ